ncbi:GNAT family N-acetyltransferase [Reinekea marinisedimentorum]|uniref:Acetyltransferase (GNAT) family protein n=1 Tax=Reinekea marinisedimentorum TaxID=230495 RepID=A0A4R3I4P6_9GAMM|nr:GNAT family N-acetyltransferase [Reinekea marinisedimentorum]TCS40206.1 acetyltransferase (GNAT) family protein [Reinekea marinisedimentorum]
MGITKPELLTADHNIENFNCGNEELDSWLAKKALKSQNRSHARVYVATDSATEQVVGYYAISMGSVQREASISPLKRNSPNPIPMVILGRLAVHEDYQGHSIGSGLLKDCVLRSTHAMSTVGGAGILVHAIDEAAQKFYLKFGFTESPFDTLTLMARIVDIEAAMSV